MAAANFTPEQMQKIKEVTAKSYADQAIFYLNAFWKDSNKPAEAEAEEVWKLAEAFAKEDHVNGKNGNELNPIQAFHVLQARNQTLTALELKAQLRKVDIDANGEMALAEYLLFINDRDPIAFINNPQGSIDPAKLKALEDKFAELDRQLQELTVKEQQAKEAEAAAKQAEADAIARENASKAAEQVALDEEAKAKAAEQKALDEEAAAKAAEAHARAEEAVAAEAEAKAVEATNKLKAVEDELRAVEDEARVIDAEIKAQEKAKQDEMARLEALTQDQSVGIVKRNMAVQQLATLKNEDSLPLQKAKLTQEAVVRRLAKVTQAAADETAIAKVVSDEATAKREVATQAANAAEAARKQAEDARAAAVAAREAAEQRRAEAVAAREAAEQARAAAVAAREAAEQAVKAVQEALAATQQALADTEAELEALKDAGVPLGYMFWQQRTLEDKKRSLPTRMW